MTMQTKNPVAATAATFELRLYVAGQTPKSLAAVATAPPAMALYDASRLAP